MKPGARERLKEALRLGLGNKKQRAQARSLLHESTEIEDVLEQERRAHRTGGGHKDANRGGGDQSDVRPWEYPEKDHFWKPSEEEK